MSSKASLSWRLGKFFFGNQAECAVKNTLFVESAIHLLRNCTISFEKWVEMRRECRKFTSRIAQSFMASSIGGNCLGTRSDWWGNKSRNLTTKSKNKKETDKISPSAWALSSYFLLWHSIEFTLDHSELHTLIICVVSGEAAIGF